MTSATPPSSPQSPGNALTTSIGSDSIDLLATVADTTIDAAISSGALDGVPIVGLISGGFKAQKEIRELLYLKKVIRLLEGVGSTSRAERAEFVRKLQERNEFERFGETILLILERVDDATKPTIIGRILAAHMKGDIPSYERAMRLVAMIDRAYTVDLNYLRNFVSGVQRGEGQLIAATLAAVGLLSGTGFDGGGFDQEAEPGGTTYAVNDYGTMLVTFGLS